MVEPVRRVRTARGEPAVRAACEGFPACRVNPVTSALLVRKAKRDQREKTEQKATRVRRAKWDPREYKAHKDRRGSTVRSESRGCKARPDHRGRRVHRAMSDRKAHED